MGMRSLSTLSALLKNKLSSDGAWLVLLEIQVPAVTTLRIVRNNEDIVWGGYTWTAFPFELDDLTEDGKELPQLGVRVSNVSRVVQGYLEAANGGSGSTVILRVVHSKHLNQPAVLEETFQVIQTKCNATWATFTLGIESPLRRRVPIDRNLTDYCRFARNYGGPECGVAAAMKSTYPTCPGTLEACRVRQNSARFGGEPGLLRGGSYV